METKFGDRLGLLTAYHGSRKRAIIRYIVNNIVVVISLDDYAILYCIALHCINLCVYKYHVLAKDNIETKKTITSTFLQEINGRLEENYSSYMNIQQADQQFG